MAKYWTDDRLAEVEDLYYSGAAVNEIASIFGRSKVLIYRLLKHRGIKRNQQQFPIRKKTLYWTETRIDEVAKLYNSGKEIKAIADTFGKSTGTIYQLISQNRSLFIKPQKTTYWSDERKKQLVELWKTDLTVNEIAVFVGKTSSSILGIIRRNRKLFPQRRANSGNKIRKIRVRNPSKSVRTLTIRPKDVIIEDPPKDIPVPEGALKVPYDELETGMCQWSLGDFWDEPSDKFICCGLPIDKNRFCEYHAKKGVMK